MLSAHFNHQTNFRHKFYLSSLCDLTVALRHGWYLFFHQYYIDKFASLSKHASNTHIGFILTCSRILSPFNFHLPQISIALWATESQFYFFTCSGSSTSFYARSVVKIEFYYLRSLINTIISFNLRMESSGKWNDFFY